MILINVSKYGFWQTFNNYEFHHFQLISQISTHGILTNWHNNNNHQELILLKVWLANTSTTSES
jgi:hypothetical protein